MSNKSISISSPDLLPLVLEGPKSTAFNLPRRIWKLGLAGGVLFAGMFGILTESKYVSTNDAVVSTYVETTASLVETYLLSVRIPNIPANKTPPASPSFQIRLGKLKAVDLGPSRTRGSRSGEDIEIDLLDIQF